MNEIKENNLNNWLPPLLEERGLTVERFAQELGITRAAVYRYLNGSNRPSDATLMKIAEVLQVPAIEAFKQVRTRRSVPPAGV